MEMASCMQSGKHHLETFSSPENAKRKCSSPEIADSKIQIFNDPIHGFIEVHPLLVQIIHTPQFQRLKDIKQLGTCYWVFPGASHNRFEHCLGTAYLSGKLIDTLRDLHRDEYEITVEESLCVKIAGLCHDLGHGPFSHFFDGKYIPRAKPGRRWEHEDASCELFDHMIRVNPELKENFNAYGLDDEEIVFIKDLIRGKDPEKDVVERKCSKTHLPKWFLYEIVSNKRNGIDCDKFDYFARDCANVGVKSNFDHMRYFQNVCVLPIDQRLEICVRDKVVFNLYELFHTRWSLHHRVYQHKTQAPIEELLAEALLQVDKILGISESIENMQRFTNLTDSIIYDILRSESQAPEMRSAQELISQIQRRQLYKFCGQTQPDVETSSLNEREIASELAELSGGKLVENEVFVSVANIHFGMKHKDPVDSVVFFNKSFQPLKVRREQVSQVLPQKFHECYVRVYAKKPENSAQLQECFRRWCEDRGYTVPHMLQGDRTGYFSPAFKIKVGSPNGAATGKRPTGISHPRKLESDFDKCSQ